MATSEDAAEQARINLRITTQDTGTSYAVGQGTQINIDRLVYFVSQGSTAQVAEQLTAIGEGDSAIEDHPMVVASGIVTVGRHIARTLGPAGRRAAVRDSAGVRHEAADALGIVALADTEDKRERIGALMMRELVHEVHAQARDGCATAAVLTHHMVVEAVRLVAAGAHPAQVAGQLRAACEQADRLLERQAVHVQARHQIEAVARTAADGRQDIARLIADGIDRVGFSGILTVEEVNTPGLDLQHTSGITLDSGYVSSYFVTDHARAAAVLDDVDVLILDQYQPTVAEVMPLLEVVVPRGRPLLVVADDFVEDFLNTLVVNKVREVFTSVVVKAPAHGPQRRQLLEDLAVATGGQLVREPAQLLQGPGVLGTARRVISYESSTALIGTGGDPGMIRHRLGQMRTAIDRARSDEERGWHQYRWSRLALGAAVLRIGGTSHEGLQRNIGLTEKAIAVSRSAGRHGCLPGGGNALLNLPSSGAADPSSYPSDDAGWQILRAALPRPAYQLADNAGRRPEPGQAESWARQGQCLDAVQGRVVDPAATGITDSGHVVRTALAAAGATAVRFLELL